MASQRDEIWLCIQVSIESDSLQDGMEEINSTLAQSSLPEMSMTSTDRSELGRFSMLFLCVFLFEPAGRRNIPKRPVSSGCSGLVALEMILFKYV